MGAPHLPGGADEPDQVPLLRDGRWRVEDGVGIGMEGGAR